MGGANVGKGVSEIIATTAMVGVGLAVPNEVVIVVLGEGVGEGLGEIVIVRLQTVGVIENAPVLSRTLQLAPRVPIVV